MSIQNQIQDYLASQPEPKRQEMLELHHAILELMPECRLWFLDGRDEKGKVVSNFLNVRNGPSTANAKVAELKQGALVTIYETSSNGWHRIGVNQWVIGTNIQEV